MVVCYSVVWYCMVGYGMVWVLTIDGCSLQMGAKHPSVENKLFFSKGFHHYYVWKEQRPVCSLEPQGNKVMKFGLGLC